MKAYGRKENNMFRRLIEENKVALTLMAEETMLKNEKYYDKSTRLYLNGVFQKPEIKEQFMKVMEEFRMFGGIFNEKIGMEGLCYKKISVSSSLVNDMACGVHKNSPDIEVSYELRNIIVSLFNEWMKNWLHCGIEECKILGVMSGDFEVNNTPDGKSFVIEKVK